MKKRVRLTRTTYIVCASTACNHVQAQSNKHMWTFALCRLCMQAMKDMATSAISSEDADPMSGPYSKEFPRTVRADNK